jgi:hypothetical protein
MLTLKASAARLAEVIGLRWRASCRRRAVTVEGASGSEPGVIGAEELPKPSGGSCDAVGSLAYARKEERQQYLPIALGTDSLEKVVIIGAVLANQIKEISAFL